MPLYTYLCKKCSKKFDLLVGLTCRKEELICPYCKTKELEKRFSTFGILGNLRSLRNCSSCSSRSCSTCF